MRSTSRRASSENRSPDDEPEKPPPADGRTLGLVGLLIELLLPVTVSAAVLLLLAGYTSWWNLRSRVGLGVFAILLVASSLFLSLRLDTFTLARRRRRGKRQLFNRADATSRLVKLGLGGLVIPIAAFLAANRVELPNHQTPMSLAVRLGLGRAGTTHAEQLGNAVLRAGSPAAKVQGILALQALGSGEALDQLLRILSEDPAALAGGGEGQALSRALASYGAQARTVLLQRLEQSSPQARREAAAPPGDLFDRYFAADFEGLKREIDREDLGPKAGAERGERLEVAQADLERALRRLETDGPPAEAGRRLPAFVMQTFLEMGLERDKDLLSFARRTAADAAWSDAVRGQALLLIAKLGGKDDLEGLYAYLDNPSVLLQARASQAIAELESKLSAAPDRG
jgi:hypothetical protein